LSERFRSLAADHGGGGEHGVRSNATRARL